MHAYYTMGIETKTKGLERNRMKEKNKAQFVYPR